MSPTNQLFDANFGLNSLNLQSFDAISLNATNNSLDENGSLNLGGNATMNFAGQALVDLMNLDLTPTMDTNPSQASHDCSFFNYDTSQSIPVSMVFSEKKYQKNDIQKECDVDNVFVARVNHFFRKLLALLSKKGSSSSISPGSNNLLSPINEISNVDQLSRQLKLMQMATQTMPQLPMSFYMDESFTCGTGVMGKMREEPPGEYLCHVCFRKGHWIKECPFVSRFISTNIRLSLQSCFVKHNFSPFTICYQ